MGNSGNNQIKKGQQKDVSYNKSMFNFNRVIGKGGFGRVWKVMQKKTKKFYALKVIDKARVISKKSVQSIINQKQILSRLIKDQSQFIVNMKCSFQDRQNCYLLMDYLQSGDLRYYINRSYTFNQQQIKFLIRCLVEGLNHLHQRNIIHRDMKPQNIILDKSGYVRITDLGIARYWKPENSHQTSGTPGYMSPEVLLRQNHSFCADLYAVGVISYQLIVGKRPYSGRDRKTIRQEMLSKEAKIPNIYLSRISKQCADFVNRLLHRTSKKRLGYNGISQVLMHPWLYLKYQQRMQFLKKNVPSPIIPLQITFSQSLQEQTEPDDLWRQNVLLLKKPQTQQMFDGYDYTPSQQKVTDNKSKQTRGDSVSTEMTMFQYK